jgi:hypothetical protein
VSTPRRDQRNNLNAVIEHVLTRPISAADRLELQAIQDDLERLHQRVAAILGGYDLDILREPVDAAFLDPAFLRDLGPLTLARDEPSEAISRS